MRPEPLGWVMDRHFNALTRFGLLPAAALAETVQSLGLDSYYFEIHAHGRAVPTLDLRGPEPLPEDGGATRLIFENCRFEHVRPRNAQDRLLINTAIRHCQFILLNTLVWKNLQKREHRNLYEVLTKVMAAKESNVTVETLPSILRQVLQIRVDVVERAPRKRLPKSEKFDQAASPGSFLRRSSRRGSFTVLDDPDLVRLIEDEALGRATTLDVTRFIAPGQIGRGDPVVLVPLCRSSARRSSRAQLLLLQGSTRRPLTREKITTVEAAITFFLDEILYRRQRDYIQEMLGEITRASSAGADIDVEAEFARVLQRSVNRVVTDTTAYRCSIWRPNQRHNVIQPAQMASYETGKLRQAFQTARSAIPIANTTASSVAYVLAGAEGDGCLLVNDCSSTARDLMGRAIIDIIPPTGETQSEFAVQIRDQGVPIAVMLAESRLLRGFDPDFWFIQTVCGLLSEFRRTLHQRLDSSFISERLSLLDQSHDLDVFIDLNMADYPDAAEELRRYLRLGRYDLADDTQEEMFHMEDLITSLEADYRMRTKDAKDNVFSRIFPGKLPAFVGTRQLQRSLRYILKNLVSNAFRYEEKSRTTIGMRIEPRSVPWAQFSGKPGRLQRLGPGALGSVFRIECVITPALTEAIEQEIGKRSVYDGRRGGRRGLYLVGLIVRQLSGTMEVHRTGDDTKTRLLIRVPIQTAGGDHDAS